MSRKRELLTRLKRDELLAAVDRLGLDASDRRSRDALIDVLAGSHRAALTQILEELPRNRLKELCLAVGLDDTGREKTLLMDRLLSSSSAEDRREGVKAATTPPAPAAGPEITVPAPRASVPRKLTLAQLERHLFAAADILRGKMDASEFKEYIFGMLFLKRCSDEFEARRDRIIAEQLERGRTQADAARRADAPEYYADSFFVPPRARWAHIRDELHRDVGDGLNKALAALEEANPGLEGVLGHIDFNRTVGQSRIPDRRLRQLIDHFNRYRLRNDDFEFPDLLGAAYEYLIGEFADSAGKKGGEFYTPRAVVRMMVRLAKPQEGMRVYDPCSGSGGMLILSHEYVAEHGGNPRDLRLYGQDSNGGVWSISKMNMILHGIPDADIQNDDTLANPRHLEGGELMRFDRVITNPPFSQNYSREGIRFPERFVHGWCPTTGKKADLMFVQHMLAVLRPGGMVVTVMPHGVLFRGGEEKKIRTAFVTHDLLDAVIGLGPNLFYGTGIPACVLVFRAPGAKPPARRGKVLFINADTEYREGRAQNYIEPEHTEKIVAAYERFEDIPRFAAVVSHDDLATTDCNLNIRRYADNSPPLEPHDVRAHLLGGVPKVEVDAQAALFQAHGFDPASVFVSRDPHYLDFAPDLREKADLRRRIEEDAGVHAQEARLSRAFHTWWADHQGRLVDLPKSQDLMAARTDLLDSFVKALVPVGLLDPFVVAGVVARWWGAAQFDLKTLVVRGFSGVIEGWVTTITSAIEETTTGNRTDQLDHPLVKGLLPDFVREISEAETRVAGLEANLEAAQPSDEDEEESTEEALSEDQVRALKKELSTARTELKTVRRSFVDRLETGRAGLSPIDTQRLVLDILRGDLESELSRAITTHRRGIVSVVDNWWDKYQITLRELEQSRGSARTKLDQSFKELRYV